MHDNLTDPNKQGRNQMQVSGEIVIEESCERTAEEVMAEADSQPEDAPRLFIP